MSKSEDWRSMANAPLPSSSHLSTIYKSQVTSVLQYAPLALMSSAPKSLMEFDTIQLDCLSTT